MLTYCMCLAQTYAVQERTLTGHEALLYEQLCMTLKASLRHIELVALQEVSDLEDEHDRENS